MLTVPAPATYREAAAQWFAITAAFCGFLFGYNVGAVPGALASLKIAFGLSPSALSLIATAALACAIPGAVLFGLFADRFGRRYAGMAASAVFAAASLTSALAPTAMWVIIGRAIAGLGIGACAYLGPLYISEIAPAETRGGLVAVNQLLIPAGVLVALAVDLLLASGVHWRWMFAAELVPSAALGLAMFRLPESPRWLVLRRQFEEARHVLACVRPTEEEVEDEMILMESAAWDTHYWKALIDPSLRPALIIAMTIAVLQQLTGLNAILYYAPAIFKLTGLVPERELAASVFAICGVSILMIAFALKLLDRLGRRPLLLAGLGGMTFSLGLLGAIFRLSNTTPALAWMATGGLLLYSASFAISFGAVFWLLIAEIFPLRIRSLAMGLATAVTFVAYLAAAACTRIFVERLGLGNALWLYMAISAGALAFSYFAIPETRGWMLEDISDRLIRWRRHSPANRRR